MVPNWQWDNDIELAHTICVLNELGSVMAVVVVAVVSSIHAIMLAYKVSIGH